ncbi:gamma carbonic anhydrase family protein [Acidisphaera sp. L21]|uniref:gamma carbonic anhydrase family protein n=1 Tax=Acidisphaera sp. L21 TaxID=1641851 RepID=UPI0020B15B77|nr:gamma carbonic anhydrase family protein [Acidisphaera sp. L21]
MPADGPLWALDGVAPQVADDVWVAPTAAVIGNVVLRAGVGIWWHCVLRGDTNHIHVGDGTNIQDGTIVHVNAGSFPTLIGRNVTIGHACIIHACTLEDRAFVGMGATVLDGATIQEGGMLAAGGLLTPGKVIGRTELWAGSPARLVRVMAPAERAKWDQTAVHYTELGRRFRSGLTPVR